MVGFAGCTDDQGVWQKKAYSLKSPVGGYRATVYYLYCWQQSPLSPGGKKPYFVGTSFVVKHGWHAVALADPKGEFQYGGSYQLCPPVFSSDGRRVSVREALPYNNVVTTYNWSLPDGAEEVIRSRSSK